MDKTNLVYTETEFQDGHMKIPAMRPLRHIAGTQPDHVVFGIGYNIEHFNHYFKFWYDKVMADWTDIGLVVDGQPVSFNKFKEFLDIHTVSSFGKSKDFVGYISKSRECMYQFMTTWAYTNKAKAVSEMYINFVSTVEGRMDCVDEGIINFGNCGIPISGGKLAYRWYDKKATEEFVDDLFKES